MLIHILTKPKPVSSIVIILHVNTQPKLKKPKELKGIKQAFSVDWIDRKCRCSCYVLDNDIYIKHRDFGSIPLYGLTAEEKKMGKGRFIFNDNWGCVVLRGEAWIILKDVIADINNEVFVVKIFQKLAEQITGEFGCCEWERFFERIIWEYNKWKEIG